MRLRWGVMCLLATLRTLSTRGWLCSSNCGGCSYDVETRLLETTFHRWLNSHQMVTAFICYWPPFTAANGPISHYQSRAKHLPLCVVNYKIPTTFFRFAMHCVERALWTSIILSRNQPHKRMSNSALLSYAKTEGILDHDCRGHHYIFIPRKYLLRSLSLKQNIVGRRDLVFPRDRIRAFAEGQAWQWPDQKSSFQWRTETQLHYQN